VLKHAGAMLGLRLEAKPQVLLLRAPGRVVGVELDGAVGEAVVLGNSLAVELRVLDSGAGFDQILRDSEGDDALSVVRAGEDERDCELPLVPVVLLDYQVVVLDPGDVPERELVARDDLVAFHSNKPTRSAGMEGSPGSFQGKTGNARVAAMGETTPEAEPRKLAEEARDRVRFEEEALELADQVYRVARRLVSTREEAEDLMQETYSRAFRAWRSYQPGTNLRAWLLRILTNLNIDRGRRQQRSPDMQPLEEGDYFLYNKLEEAGREPNLEQERVDERLSQDDVVSALSAVPHDFRDVIVLVDIGDFSYADAAQILEIPIGTVMSRLHRGRRILKGQLAEQAVSA
jgi:RNA polymerase sigma-70 factor, ECF subfamily